MHNDFRRVMRGPNAPPLRVQGVAADGRIARLSAGQCHGAIRAADGRDVWFHRNDMIDPASFNKCAVGDAVTFELIDDRISGARALLVRRMQ